LKTVKLRIALEEIPFQSELDYTNVITASSNGHKYRLYTDGYYACRETETNKWVNGDMDSTCTWD